MDSSGKVLPVPRFKRGEQVVLITSPLKKTSEAGQVHYEAFLTVVEALHHQKTLGWLYNLRYVNGLMPEAWLQPYDPANVLPIEPDAKQDEFIPQPVTREQVLKLASKSAFQIGDYALSYTYDDHTDPNDHGVPIYLLVLGKVMDGEVASYDCAVLNEKQEFMNAEDIFFEDEMEPLTVEAFETVLEKRKYPSGKPRLSVISNPNR